MSNDQEFSRRGVLGATAAITAGATATAASSETFSGHIGLTMAQSTPAYRRPAPPPSGSPNVLVVVLDDVGYSDLGCYGGEIATPAMDALATGGLRYTNFRTTGVCSATRASLFTGLNPHSAGIGWLTFADAGYPGYRGDLTHEAATLAETLTAHGYAAYHCGKWHVNADASATTVGPMDNWPTQRGYQRAYWFQGHSTDYFNPSKIFDGNQRVEVGGGNYYVTDDLADRAIRYLHEHAAEAPDRPFFLSLALSAAHSPLQAPAADIAAQRGRYDRGWDSVRDTRLARQIELGIVPGGTQLPGRGPGVSAWADLSADQQRLYARHMETYAAVLSRADAAIGRVMEALRATGAHDNTLVVIMSDNGGSPDGGPTGVTNLMGSLSGGQTLQEAVAQIDQLGGPNTYPMYPMGWGMASNTPYRLYKHTTHLGGVADPLIVSWPIGIATRGEIRPQYVHVCDLFPTVTECVGAPLLAERNGVRMKPIHGRSIRSTFADATARATRTEQHFEMNGMRAYYADGWRLVSKGVMGRQGDGWELYNLRAECNEVTDLAASEPRRVADLERRWLGAARRYDVLPVDTRTISEKSLAILFAGGGRTQWEFIPPLDLIPEDGAPALVGRAHQVDIELEQPLQAGDQGVLYAYGNIFMGHVLFLKDGQLVHEMNCAPRKLRTVTSSPLGATRIGVRHSFETRPWRGAVALTGDGRDLAQQNFERLLFGPAMQGLQIGRNTAAPASLAYATPFPFTGAIRRVSITVDDTPYTPAEIATLARR